MQDLNFAGDFLPVTIRVGGSAPFIFDGFEDENGDPVTTIASASLKFYSGVISGNSALTLIVAPTMTVTDGSQVTGELTPTDTRLFTPGDDQSYCYGFEITASNGRVYPICHGPVEIQKELPA